MATKDTKKKLNKPRGTHWGQGIIICYYSCCLPCAPRVPVVQALSFLGVLRALRGGSFFSLAPHESRQMSASMVWLFV